MSPNLLLYPVSDKRKAFTRIAHCKIIHPTTKDRVDLFDHPTHWLTDIFAGRSPSALPTPPYVSSSSARSTLATSVYGPECSGIRSPGTWNFLRLLNRRFCSSLRLSPL